MQRLESLRGREGGDEGSDTAESLLPPLAGEGWDGGNAAYVLRVADLGPPALHALLRPYALKIEILPAETMIPGSYSGDVEAGLIADTLYARADTPVHSVLHEAAHFVCMDAARRGRLQQDAGGDHAEENAVCYLQILWADALAGFSRERMWRDMDGRSCPMGNAAS